MSFSKDGEAQDNLNVYPEVGEKCPEFELAHVEHGIKTNLSLSDIKNKWTILDFWGAGCVACVESFPKLTNIQNKFNGKLQIILIGYQDKDDQIRKIYEKFRSKLKMNLTVAYDSSSFFDQFVYRGGVPLLIWIDDHGTVKAITSSTDLTSENINKFLSHHEFSFENYSRKTHIERAKFVSLRDKDTSFTSSLRNIPNGEILEGSYIKKWQPNYEDTYTDNIDESIKRYHSIVQTGTPLLWLYNLAYTGKTYFDFSDSGYNTFYSKPILEIKDFSFFDKDLFKTQNRYDYNLLVPPSKINSAYLMQRMQQDLSNHFGFEVSIEKRSVPVWKLIATETAKIRLKTKGGEPYMKDFRTRLEMRNFPVYRLINLIYYYHVDDINFFDGTGIKDNIDLTLDCPLTDLNDLKLFLREHGLDLVKEEKEMKVLIIRDPKDNHSK